MTSILTNVAAMSALSILRDIDTDMETTQNRISSGYKVGSAQDNAAYWSIASTMRSDNEALATVSDALGLGQAKADTAYAGLDRSKDIIIAIQKKLESALQPGVDKGKVQQEITELKNQLVSIASASSFSSENWLYNAASTSGLGTKTMVGAFVRSESNAISIQTIDYDASDSCLFDKVTASHGILTKSIAVSQPSGTTTTQVNYFLCNISGQVNGGGSSGVTSTEISISSATTDESLRGMLNAVNSMLNDVTNAATTLGAVQSRLTTQSAFVKDLRDTITKGVGRLVDADMNEESTRLKALQTQQQLAIQSLTIANSSAQTIMQLFR